MTPTPPTAADNARKAADDFVRDVAELPDRTSPEDAPGMLLVSADELRGLFEKHYARLNAAPIAADGEREAGRAGFEAFAKSKHYTLEQLSSGRYRYNYENTALDFYRAGMAEPCTAHPIGCRTNAIGRANIKALWEALDAIREFVEDIAPPGSMQAQEYADNPEPMTEAQEIIKGIQAIVDANKPKPTPIMIFTGEP